MTLVRLAILLVPALLIAPARAQRDDGPQTPLPIAQKIEPAPPKSAADELKTFQLPAGFKIELIADESLVRDPVAAAFDLEGNLWVAEMTRFNVGIIQDVPRLAGGVTSVPSSSIVKLSSSRRDGHYDRRTVFLDGLNAPRAITVVHDGILFADPPRLWLARDTDGDGKCDERKLITEDYGIDLINESNANGLVYGRDNIIHNICFPWDYRFRNGSIERLPTQVRGEYGLTQDDFGRLFFNRNSDQLRCDLFSPLYTLRNPDATVTPWANYNVATSQEIWPSHATPAVNRGYRKAEIGKSNGGIRDDGTLAEFSAACSPLIYRGSNFPTDCYGNAFVPEPAANLVKRNLLQEQDGRIRAVDAYRQKEFLTSTDPRFRPVSLLNAPDGSMYIVDLYRGFLEEYHLTTPYLIEQTIARGLHQPMYGRGRIWRVTYSGAPLETKMPDLGRSSGAALAAALEHPNGWWRDAAQQELVERGDRSAIPALTKLVHDGRTDITRAAALWTLDGLGAAQLDVLAEGLKDSSPKVRAAAVHLHESHLAGANATAALRQLHAVENDFAPEVILQLAFTLGASRSPESLDTLYRVWSAHGKDDYLAPALLTGLQGREIAFFRRLSADASKLGASAEAKSLFTLLASTIVHRGERANLDEVLGQIGDQGKLPTWARVAVIQGLSAVTQPAFRRTMSPGRAIKAEFLEPLLKSKETDVSEAASKLHARVAKLEAEAQARRNSAKPLTPAEQKLAEAGKATFQICAGCHQMNGAGLPNVAPSLVESPLVTGNPEMLVRIVLNGKEGTPGFPGAMPPIGAAFSDEQIAGVLTYIRNSWGLQAGAVPTETVTKVRSQVAKRVNAWTTAELNQLDREFQKAGR